MINDLKPLNLPSFNTLLERKRIFLSGSFDQSVSGIPTDLDHNEANFLFREIIQLLLVNKAHLIFGGHPSVSKIVYQIASRLDETSLDYISLYQSQYFKDSIPEFLKISIDWFNTIIWTEKKESLEESLSILRKQMLFSSENSIDFSIFIGGGKGLSEECELIKKYSPNILRIYFSGAGGFTSILAKENKAEVLDNITDYNFQLKIKAGVRDFQFIQLNKEKLRKVLFFSLNR